VKAKVFVELAQNKEEIELNDLVQFLEGNKFYVRREDLEAILRRIDHEGNQKINFEEFCEATSVNERNLSAEEDEQERLGRSPVKEDLEKQLTSERKRGRSNSRKDLLHDDLDKAMEKYESSQKEEAKQGKGVKGSRDARKKLSYEGAEKNIAEEEKEEENPEDMEGQEEPVPEKPLEFKFLSLLKNQLKMEKDIEIQRECLFSHENFSSIDTFKIID